MLKTDRLYYMDCTLREFDARVVEVQPTPEGSRVYLDRSAFYPASGGQPSDRGALDGARVLDVVDEGASVAHILDRSPAADSVHGVIDWARRFDHMQQHTGQHVLSAAFEETAQITTISFHLGEELSTIDLDSDRVSARQVEQAESRANEVIFENRPVGILFRSADEARQMNLRKPAGREGEVRLIRIEDFDLSACGGTHVSRTGSVGLIVVRKIGRMKDHTRVDFVCGGRALRYARNDFRLLSETGMLLSSAPAKLPELVRKQSEEARAACKRIEKLTRSLAEYHARELWAAAPERDGRKIIRRIFNSDESAEARMVAQAAGALERCVALIGVRDKPSTLYFAQCSEGTADLGAILKKTVATFGGRGGGTRNSAQGGGLDQAELEEALVYAEGLLIRDLSGKQG